MEYRIIIAVISALLAGLIAFTNPANDLFDLDKKVFNEPTSIVSEPSPSGKD